MASALKKLSKIYQQTTLPNDVDLIKLAARLRPDEAAMRKKAEAFLAEINRALASAGLKASAQLGGSFAKGTFLVGDHDVDVFVRFDRSYPNEALSDLLASALKGFRPSRVHGSRDYFKIRSKGLNYEIVPVYALEKVADIVNIMDASPFHVAWFKRRCAVQPALADQIRLIKAFLKANGLYGAESWIRGFSGHLVDILAAYYGSFEALLRAAANWTPKIVIDIENAHKGKALEVLNPSKTEGPLIVVDPIQAKRNAAAALSEEKFNAFVALARAWLAHPSEKFFKPKPFSLTALRASARSQGKALLLLTARPRKDSEDIMGAGLLRSWKHIKEKLEEHDFKVLDAGFDWSRKPGPALFWFVLETAELEAERIVRGPPLANKVAVQRFKAAHAQSFEREGRVLAKVRRRFTKAQELVAHLAKESELLKKKLRSLRVKR